MIEIIAPRELRIRLIYPLISFGELRSMNLLNSKAREEVTSVVKFGTWDVDGHVHRSGVSGEIKPPAWSAQQILLATQYAIRKEYKPHLNKKIMIDGREYKLT